jgi:hypothetical protein
MDPEPKTKKQKVTKAVEKPKMADPIKTIIRKKEPRKTKKRVHVEKSNAQLLASHKGIRQLFKKLGGTYNIHRVTKLAIDAIKAVYGEEQKSAGDVIKLIQFSAQIASRRDAKTVNDLDVKLSIQGMNLFSA